MNEFRKQRQLLFEGLAGMGQEKLSPEEVQNVTKSFSEFVKSHPEGYTLSYEADTAKDIASISFQKINDLNGQSKEVVYQMPYKFKKDLHSLASKLWQKLQNEKHPAPEINKDDALKSLDASSKHVDWSYEYSDDPHVYSAGKSQMSVLTNALERAALSDPVAAKEIVLKNFPRNKQSWANSFIDKKKSQNV